MCVNWAEFHEGLWKRRGDREMVKEWLGANYLGEVYCKKCKKEGSLVAEMKTAGNNLHIDFIVQHDDQRGTTHFMGRKICRAMKGKSQEVILLEASHRLEPNVRLRKRLAWR